MARTQVLGGTTGAVTGVDEFARALRKVSPQLKRELDKQNRAIGRVVVADAKSAASGVSRQAAKAATSLRASAARGGVAISLGGSRAPFALGAEYGAKKYAQFMPWRGNQWTTTPTGVGYFMHPTIRAAVPNVVDKYLDAARAAAAQAGLRMAPGRASALDIARTVN
jgi:hypothetical protein